MRDESKPQILVSQIGDAVRDGAWIEIDCEETAFRDGNQNRGLWRPFVCDHVRGSDQVERAVVVATRGLQPRTFKTIVGLSRFAMDLGMDKCEFPLVEGEIAVWKFDG